MIEQFVTWLLATENIGLILAVGLAVYLLREDRLRQRQLSQALNKINTTLALVLERLK